MDAVEFYSTTVVDQDTGLSASVLTTPPVAFEESRQVYEYLSSHGLEVVTGEVGASFLPHLIIAAWTSETVEDLHGKTGAYGESPTAIYEEEERHPGILAFSHYLAYSDLVPVEESPLEKVSLAGMASRAPGVGAGSALGFLMVGSSPFLIVTVPFGIFLCTAAAAAGPLAGQALGGLFEHLAGRFTGTRDAEQRVGQPL